MKLSLNLGTFGKDLNGLQALNIIKIKEESNWSNLVRYR